MPFLEHTESWINTLCKRSISFAEKKLTDITIPGSHDAATYTLNIVKSFSVTQTKSLQQQFTLGVRYFDIRIKSKGGGLAFFHGLVSSESGIVKAELAGLFSTCIAHKEPIIIKLHFEAFTSFSKFSSAFFDEDLKKYIIRPSEFRNFPIRWLINNDRYIAIVTKHGGAESEFTMDYHLETFGGWANTRDIDKLESKMKSVRADISSANTSKLRIVQTNQPALSGSGGDRFAAVIDHDSSAASRHIVRQFIIDSADIITSSVNNNKPTIEAAIQQVRGVISLDNIGGDSGKDLIVQYIISLNDQEAYEM